MGDHKEDCGETADAQSRERDYDGTFVLRGFGNGFALAGVLWVGVAVGGYAEVGLWPHHAASAPAAGPAAAEGQVDCEDVPLPPQEFDHPATIPLFVRRVPFGQVDRLCRDHGAAALITTVSFDSRSMSATARPFPIMPSNFEAKACSWTFARLGFVILPEAGKGGVTDAWNACALRHEVGHINGWPASHPDAHYLSP